MPRRKEEHSPTDLLWRIPGIRAPITTVRPEDNSLLGQYHNAIDHVLGRKAGEGKASKEGETEWYTMDGVLHSIHDFDGMTITGTSREKASLGEIDEMGPRGLVNYTRQTDLSGFREYFSTLAEQEGKPRMSRQISDMTNNQLYNYAKEVDPEELRRYLLRYEPDTVRKYALITDPEKLKELYEAGTLSGRPVEYKNKKKRR